MLPKKFILLTLMFMLSLSAANGAELPEEMQSLVDFYQNLESVHLRAKVEISIRAPLFEGHPAPVTGDGLIEHWENGEGFRTRASFDPRLGLIDSFDIALTEGKYQLYNSGTNVLAIESPKYSIDGLVQVPIPAPNPIFLPSLFLAPSDDLCPGCQMRLDFVSDSDRWQDVYSAMTGVSETARELGNEKTSFGGHRQGESYRFKIHAGPVERAALNQALAQESAITRIERIRSDGKTIATYTFSDFKIVEGSGGHRFPMRILVAAHDPDAELDRLTTSFTEYTIETLEVNVPFQKTMLSVRPGPDIAVWDHGELVRR